MFPYGALCSEVYDLDFVYIEMNLLPVHLGTCANMMSGFLYLFLH